MEVVWFVRALQDMHREVTFIKSRNPDAAAKVRRRLQTAVEHLDAFPRAGRIGRKVGTREIVITEYPYVIRYRIADDQVQILRIFHTSTHWTVS